MKVTPPVSYGFTVASGGPVDVGDVIEVDDETGAQLVAQGWSVPTAKQAKAAEKAAAESEAVPDTVPEADAEADPKENA